MTREVDHYNLDAIIAVGYRVNSYQATQFRIWATQSTLKEYIVKGFVLDDERLKAGPPLRAGLLPTNCWSASARSAPASEGFYRKQITTSTPACSIDYDPKAEVTQLFYKTVQNKLHWAITATRPPS